MIFKGFMSVLLALSSTVFGVAAWYAPVLLRGIPDGDRVLMGAWLVIYLFLIAMAGASALAIVAVWRHD